MSIKCCCQSSVVVNRITPREHPRPDEILRRMWELEKVPGETTPYTLNELAPVQHFTDYVVFWANERYSVSLLLCSDMPEIGESRSVALRRF